MVRHPVLGALAQMMWSFNSLSALYVTHFPQLQVPGADDVLREACRMLPLIKAFFFFLCRAMD